MSFRQVIRGGTRGVLRALGATLAFATLAATAQEFPTKSITVVVPYAAGGPTDVSARLLTEEMGKVLGTTFVIDNRPSAGGLLAAQAVAKAPKDGYTLLLSVGTIMSTNPSLFKKLPYQVSDFTPIAMYSKSPYVINGAPSLPVKSVAELIAFAKQKPEGLTIANVGTGTQSHIIAEWIARRLGIKAEQIPYKGVSQAVTDLSAGRVDVLTDGISTAVANHNAGKTRLVVSMGQERAGILPDGVPTFKEAGYPDLYAYSEFGLSAPAGTPEPVIRKIYNAMAAVLNTPAFREKMAQRGDQPALSASPKAYADHIEAERVRWAALIKPLNIQLD